LSRKNRRETHGFQCVKCSLFIAAEAYGTRHRNHCPRCLWSRHVDDEPGDRAAACRAPMAPIGVEVRGDGEWAVIHRCAGCRTIRTNRIAGDDSELALLQLVLRPLAHPPFPLDQLPIAR
jgi:hypothetical protein